MNRIRSGWVAESSVQRFKRESFQQYFCPKTFKKNKDYQTAIFEAIRISNCEYDEFSESLLQELFPSEKVVMI